LVSLGTCGGLFLQVTQRKIGFVGWVPLADSVSGIEGAGLSAGAISAIRKDPVGSRPALASYDRRQSHLHQPLSGQKLGCKSSNTLVGLAGSWFDESPGDQASRRTAEVWCLPGVGDVRSLQEGALLLLQEGAWSRFAYSFFTRESRAVISVAAPSLLAPVG
jgi:hypothetical protein